ncbi:hypothetical protein K1719_025983 [Acacia pycnantha]|nr:hypothetical protein K1719_025983 [Acacia pycnantha]
MEMINCSIGSSEICRCKELEERSVKAEARCAELELELQKKRKYCEALEAKLDSLEKEKKNAMDDKPKSLGISGEVNIIDNDDEPNIITQQPVLDNQDSVNISFSTRDGVAEENESEDDGDGDDSGGGGGGDDDDVPISQLKRMQFLKVSPDQLRCDSNELVTVTSPMDDQATGTVTHRRRPRKCVIKSQQDKKCSCGHSDDKHEQSIPMNKENDDDELEEVSSDNGEGSLSEGSLSNFLVHDSDESIYEDTSSKSQEASDGEIESDSHDVSDVRKIKSFHVDRARTSMSKVSLQIRRLMTMMSQNRIDVADGDLNLKEILSQIQRKKDQKRKWEFEGDMLAAFGKDPQLCMKAACTLYRQQTSEERTMKGSLHYNGRGFNNVDAFRGSTLAEFITEGDPLGDVKKTVKELEEYDTRVTCFVLEWKTGLEASAMAPELSHQIVGTSRI